MKFCRLPPEIAAAVHVITFVHPSVNIEDFVAHHTTRLGVPYANIHILVHQTDIPYHSDLKARAVNAHLRALSHTHPRAFVSQVDGDERLYLPCGLALRQTLRARMIDRVDTVCAPVRARLLHGYDRKIALTPLIYNNSVWQFVTSHSGKYTTNSSGGFNRYIRALGTPQAFLEHISFSETQRTLASTKLMNYKFDHTRRHMYETMLRINHSTLVSWMHHHAIACPSLLYGTNATHSQNESF